MEIEGGSYAVLKAGEAAPERAGVCALAVMAKAPRPGKVKTRLAPALGFEGSAAINTCFLRDTTLNIAGVESRLGARAGAGGATADGPAGGNADSFAALRNDKGEEFELQGTELRGAELRGGAGSGNRSAIAAAGLVCYTPLGDEAAFAGLLPAGFALIVQRGDAFGERLLCAAEDILSCGYRSVCLIDSDSPTLPQQALVRAVEELAKPGDRVVLGPSEDGGYYLIGLKQAHPEPFERITWSTASVYAETVQRVREAGLELVELPVWYDVDDAQTLRVLEDELLGGVRPAFATVPGYEAEATRAFLRARAETVAVEPGAEFGSTAGRNA